MIELAIQVIGVICSLAVLITWILLPSIEQRDVFDKSDIKYRDGDNT